MSIPLIILDRDGVINEDSDDYIKGPQEWHAIAGSLQAIAAMNRAGITVTVATNQSGIARGYYDEATLHEIHEKMQRELTALGGHIDHIVHCPHGPDDDCDCRKPEPGLLQQIQKIYDIPFEQCLLVGDSLRDIQAAEAVGCPSALVKTGKGLKTLAKGNLPNHIPVFEDLAHVAEELLS